MEEEISLRELIEIILRGKWLIIMFTLLAMIISIIFSFWIVKPTYEAKTILAANQIEVPQTSKEGLESLVDTFSGMPRINIQSYIAQAKSTAVLTKIMEYLNLDPSEISLPAFADKITITNIKDTELLEIRVKDNSPEKAAQIANIVAEELIQFIADKNKSKTQNALAFLEKQVDEEELKLAARVEEMKQFLQQSDTVAELQAELQTNLDLLSTFQARKVNLDVNINKSLAKIETMDAQLSKVPEKIELKKSLFEEPGLAQLYGETKEVELYSEEINPVYINLRNGLETEKATYAEFITEKNSLETEIAAISKRIKSIQVKLADRQTRMEQLQTQIDTTRENYKVFNNKYTESQVSEAMKINEAALMIVSPAHEPTVPIAPKKSLNLAVATCLGLMLGVFVVLFRSYWVGSALDV